MAAAGVLQRGIRDRCECVFMRVGPGCSLLLMYPNRANITPETWPALGEEGKDGGGSSSEDGDGEDGAQEAENRPNIPLQEKFHSAILQGVSNISDPLENNGMKFLLCMAKWGNFRRLRRRGGAEARRGPAARADRQGGAPAVFAGQELRRRHGLRVDVVRGRIL